MKKVKYKISAIKDLYQKGFFHIFGSNILSKIFSFCGGILLVRVLTKEEMGIYSYSENILALFLIINGFGMPEGLLQYGSRYNSIEDQNSYIKYSLKIGFLSNVFLGILILMYSKYGTFKIESSREIFVLMFAFPIINTLFSIIQIKLRIELRNKEMAKYSNINTFFNIFGMTLGGYIYGIVGVVIGKYIGNIFSIFISFSTIKNIFFHWRKIYSLAIERKKEMIKFSFTAMLNNGISNLLYIADVFLIGLIIGNENILASYKTATLIPFALNFIPLSIMTYIYPYFAKNSDNIEWIRKKYLEMLKYLGVFNFFISMGLILFSKLIIKLIFGEIYMDSLQPFIILSMGYFFAATIRIPAGNVLASIGKIKFNFYNALISGSINILLDIFLIKKFGSIGAAYATLLVFIISGTIGNLFLFKYLNKR